MKVNLAYLSASCFGSRRKMNAGLDFDGPERTGLVHIRTRVLYCNQYSADRGLNDAGLYKKSLQHKS